MRIQIKARTLLFQQYILLWLLVKSACAAMCAKLAKFGKFVTSGKTRSNSNQGMAQHLPNGSAQLCDTLSVTFRENCTELASFANCQPVLKTRRQISGLAVSPATARETFRTQS